MVMVKPALAYLDVIARRARRVRRPGRRVPRERRVRDGEGGGAARLDRRRRRRARAPARDQARRRRRRSSRTSRARSPSGSPEFLCPDDGLVRAGAGPHPRRRQLARARVRRGGRRAVLRRARRRARTLDDTDGNRYLDYVQSWGASILGHAHPAIVEAVQRAAADGTSFGAPTPREVELAEAICDRVPSVEKVRLVSSGTEAAMTAVRLARGATGRAEDPEVRGLLPRPPRRAARAAGQRRRHARPARVGGRHRGHRRRHDRRARTTTSTRSTRVSPRTATSSRRVLVEPVAANMGLVPPDRRLPRRTARAVHRAPARCSSSTR